MGIASLGSKLRMLMKKFERALHGLTNPFRHVRVHRAQPVNDAGVVREKPGTLVQIMRHALWR